ncbi:MAG TPA: Hsp20/alpha crystallin family protein [Terriglobia bacterium]|nr:Hsp20/alpha crystallin family protein [Terriglobia bacterium]
MSNGQHSRRKNYFNLFKFSGQEFDFASYPFLYSHQIVWTVFDDNATRRRQPELKQVEEEMIMNMKNLVPWGRERRNVPVRREEDNPFYSLQRSINQVFDNFLFDGFGRSPFSLMASFSPRLDVSETDREFHVTAELPGMDEKDVEVSLSNNLLTLRGEKKDEREDKQKDYFRMERSYGMFERTIPIPEGVDFDKGEASFRKGVLTVKLPKSAEYQKERKRIPIKAT